jgi:hypothetical protein
MNQKTHPTGHPPQPLLTRPQRQILPWLAPGDLFWERADDPAHDTVYHEKRGRDQRVSAALVTTLAEQGWIQKRPHPQADRLDSGEITPEGRALLPAPKGRHRAEEPSSGIPPNTSITTREGGATALLVPSRCRADQERGSSAYARLFPVISACKHALMLSNGFQ